MSLPTADPAAYAAKVAEPFARLPFDRLPAEPRVPHDLARSRTARVALRSSAFGDVEVLVRRWGEGPPLLLVHGLMTSSYSWRYVGHALAARLGREVIAPDWVGAGESTKVTDRRYDAPAHARLLVELVDALGIRGAPAVGNSLGGYLCMRAALLDERLFSRLVDVHSPGLMEPRLGALHVALSVPGVRAALAAFIRRDPQRWAHRNVHYFDETLKSREEAATYGAPLASREGAAAFVRILGEVLAPRDLRAFERALLERRAADQPFPIPLMLLYARRDPMVPPAMGERLAALLPGVPLEWMDNTSHFPQVDSPAQLIERISPFLGA